MALFAGKIHCFPKLLRIMPEAKKIRLYFFTLTGVGPVLSVECAWYFFLLWTLPSWEGLGRIKCIKGLKNLIYPFWKLILKAVFYWLPVELSYFKVGDIDNTQQEELPIIIILLTKIQKEKKRIIRPDFQSLEVSLGDVLQSPQRTQSGTSYPPLHHFEAIRTTLFLITLE